MGGRWVWGVGLVGSLALAVGVGVGVMVAREPLPLVLEPVVSQGSVAVVASEFDDARVLPVKPHTATRGEYRSFALGMVGRSDCVVGEPIVSGDRVGVVGGSPVVALRLPQPLWRDLWPGVKGQDVKDFQRALRRLGFDVGVHGRHDEKTSRAIAALWKKMGVWERKTFVARGDVVWLHSNRVIPSECLLKVGDEATPGDVAFRVGGGLTSLEVSVPETVVVGARNARLGDVVVPIAGGSTIDDPVFLEAFVQSTAYRTYQEGDAKQQLSVETRLVDSISVVTVPASALYGVQGVSGCVLDKSGPLSVEVVASQLGQTLVTGQVIPQEVVITPSPDAVPCR